jgi:Tol biopolymer transport system component
MRTLLFALGVLVACAGLLLACGSFRDEPLPVDDAAVPDAALASEATDAPDASDARDASPVGDGSCWTRLFGVPVNVPELSSSALELSVRLSPDERTAFLASNRGGGAGGVDLYTATRPTRSDPFGALSPLPFNTAADDTHPSLSFDGLSLYFVTAQPTPDGGSTGSDIYVASRGTSTLPFGVPTLLTALSGPSEDSFPYAAPTGGMYFASNRDGDLTIYFAARSGSSFAPPAIVESLHEPGTISNLPVVSADGLWLYFASSRGGGGAQGELDVWVTHRESLDSSFAPPVDVAELNTPSSDRPVWISNDGCRMYLTSTRAGGLGDLDVWFAAR